MGIFKKKIRDEKYFFEFLLSLTPSEMIALSKAFARFAQEMTSLNLGVGQLPVYPSKSKSKKPEDKSYQ